MELQTVREQIVVSSQTKNETRWVLLLALFTVVCCSFLVGLRNNEEVINPTKSWQIDAFTYFNPQEMGVFTSLQTAAEEIIDVHVISDDEGWPTVDSLEEEYITPFVQDTAWKNQGRITWKASNLGADSRHINIYYGIPKNDDIRGLFLLLLLHDHAKKQGNAAFGATHAPYEIWFNENLDSKEPSSITDQSLIASGWKEVIALSGDDEEKRLKGN